LGTHSEQLELQKQAIFEDCGLSFQITLVTDSIPLNTRTVSDYDEPMVHNEPPGAFTLSNLRYVGGLDISFIAEEEEEPASATLAGHNASGTSSNPNSSLSEPKPDAFGVVTVLDYPALTVSDTPHMFSYH
jgi:hypothetical protein